MGNLAVKNHFFALKRPLWAKKEIALENLKKITCYEKQFYMETLSICPLGYWQAKFGQDLFHVLPDLSAVVV